MAKSTSPRHKPAKKTSTRKAKIDTRTPLQRWCDGYGHGARSHLMKATGKRWQTIQDLYIRKRNAGPDTAMSIEKATEGAVPWESLVLINRLKDAKKAAKLAAA